MSIDTYRVLPRNTAEGRRYIFDENRNGSGDPGESSLVKMTEDGWQPVSELKGSIDRFDFEQDYGLWTDRKVSHWEGFFFPKEVIDRPLDGKIDADEVSQTTWKRYGNSSSYRVGGELEKDDEGRFYFHRHDIQYGSLRIIGPGDIAAQEAYRKDDANWKVPTQ